MSVAVFAAFAALVVGAMYGEDTGTPAPVMSGGPVDGGGERDAEAVAIDITPIQGWFPRSGVGSTCTEPVGVDLIPGYGALLIINGRTIPETELNLYENPDAPPSERVLTAQGALGRYTWGPEEDCPNGSLLRPVNNSVIACVYRLDEGPTGCRTYGPFNFDAL